jgi:hypothetical protein
MTAVLHEVQLLLFVSAAFESCVSIYIHNAIIFSMAIPSTGVPTVSAVSLWPQIVVIL